MPSWLVWPITVLVIAAVLLALLGLWQGAACRHHWGYRRRLRGSFHLLLCLALLVLAVLLAGTGYSLRGYRWLSAEIPVLGLQAQQLGPQRWQVDLQTPGGSTRRVSLHGDAWRVDAVVLKWELPAVLAGLPPVYRLQRLSSRFADPRQASRVAPSVVGFANAGTHELSELALRHQNWLPMVDTVYGSSAYMRLADGARYRVSLMRSGALVARRTDRASNSAIDAGAASNQ